MISADISAISLAAGVSENNHKIRDRDNVVDTWEGNSQTLSLHLSIFIVLTQRNSLMKKFFFYLNVFDLISSQN